MNWKKPHEEKDWQEELARMLIDGGTDGVRQSVITKRFTNWRTADELLNELEVLVAQNKAQKFVIHGRGRPVTIWRATTLILKP